MAETKLLNAPVISSSLRRMDYNWLETTPEEFGKMLAKKLKQMNAKIWAMDVYCSNDSIYRNLELKWMSFDRVKSLRIHFNREEGSHINIEH